jgi:DNA-binding transcriptional MerR regulator
MNAQQWTLDELAERVDVALAVDYSGQPSGRVRAVPDRRAIRWYTTIGLIDRPVAHRGRTALYGPRHLLQLVAVKRLQARGLPLVAIQRELAGATDTQLARVARLPASPTARDSAESPSRAGSRDGAGSPPVAETPRAAASAPRATAGAAPAAAGRGRRAEFWRGQAANYIAAHASPDPAVRVGDPDEGLEVAALRGVRLGEGATLLLEPGRELDAADMRAILDAARPLLAALRERGLGQPAGNERRREHP